MIVMKKGRCSNKQEKLIEAAIDFLQSTLSQIIAGIVIALLLHWLGL